MANQLLEPLLENGIRNTNFFNGRILTADDLKTDQEAGRRQRGQLGRAIGEGIAYGLEVSLLPNGTSVKITPGLAINRQGQVLELVAGAESGDCSPAPAASDDSVTLELSETPADGTASPDAGLFGVCSPPVTAVPSLTGVYLLVLSPASGYRERAPMKSLSASGLDAGCGSRYAVEGVTFRLVGFPAISGLSLTDPRLQNLLANLCYGTAQRQSAADYPFTDLSAYGALEALRPNELTDCDAPLALLQWQNGKIVICDVWAVRRSPFPALADAVFPVPVGPRRMAESVAQFLQFQDQIGQIPAGSLAALNLAQTFRFLPPAGYFLTGTPNFPVSALFKPFADAGKLHMFTLAPSEFRRLLASSWLLEPIDLDATLPDLNVYLSNNGADLLFLRSDTSQPVPPPAPPSGGITGTVEIFLEGFQIGAGLLNNLNAGGSGLVITAANEKGDKFTATQSTASEDSDHIVITIPFHIASLPPAIYSIEATFTQFFGSRGSADGIEVAQAIVTVPPIRLVPNLQIFNFPIINEVKLGNVNP